MLAEDPVISLSNNISSYMCMVNHFILILHEYLFRLPLAPLLKFNNHISITLSVKILIQTTILLPISSSYPLKQFIY